MRKFLRKCLLFKKQKVDSTGYYGIEDLFPDLISKLRRFIGGIRSAGCWLSRAVGSQNAVVSMLRKLSGMLYGGIYVCMDGMLFIRARGELFSPKNTAF